MNIGPIYLRSFGMRYGKPRGWAYEVIDCRTIKDPDEDRSLRQLDGTDPRVIAAVLASPTGRAVIGYVMERIAIVKPGTTFWIGCTAGRHRSVAIVDEIYRQLRWAKVWVERHHRELAKVAH